MATIRQCEVETSMSYNATFKGDYTVENQNETVGDNTNKSRGSFLEVQEVPETSEKNEVSEPQNANDSSLTCHNESKRAKLDSSSKS